MPEIRQLPPNVVNKIAAGEVIERPASVVKELLENAVDSGATRIELSVEQGGTQLVRVADNGCGIDPAQLTLAVASHATSKICSAEDIFSVRTLGFRGEALASIAEVSQLRIRSRAAGRRAGAELEVVGGVAQGVAPCGCDVGTTVEVRNLFYNTPVRRKFLRATQTEMGHATESFTRLALASEQVHFVLRHNERLIYELPPTDSWRERIATFFGPELAASLLAVAGGDGTIKVSGFVADPGQSRANNRMQYLFLNGRYIRDRSLQHALSEAYRGLLLTGRYPIAFLRLEIPVEAVDVNVHPTKLEVRFQDGGGVYSQLLAALRTRFLTSDLTARVPAGALAWSEPEAAAVEPERAAEVRRQFVDWARTGSAGVTDRPAGAGPAGAATPTTPRPGTPLPRQTPLELPIPRGPVPPLGSAGWPGTSPHPGGLPPAPWDADEQHAAASRPSTPVPRPHALQVHNRYLVAESEEGVVVIDQHALHERILYEQLREKVLAGDVETQRLLVPEPVPLAPAEAAAVLDARALLAELGIEVDAFGGDTVLISGYPAMLANLDPAETVRQLAAQLVGGEKLPARRDLLDDLLHMISCKAAIKAGDRLSPEEVASLVELRHVVQDAHHCPHGRPTTLVLTREELDRRFKRT